MTDFRLFSLGVVLSVLVMMIIRRVVGVTGLMSLDDLLRVGFLALLGGFAFVAIFGRAPS